jgi:hypothetical protein
MNYSNPIHKNLSLLKVYLVIIFHYLTYLLNLFYKWDKDMENGNSKNYHRFYKYQLMSFNIHSNIGYLDKIRLNISVK